MLQLLTPRWVEERPAVGVHELASAVVATRVEPLLRRRSTDFMLKGTTKLGDSPDLLLVRKMGDNGGRGGKADPLEAFSPSQYRGGFVGAHKVEHNP